LPEATAAQFARQGLSHRKAKVRKHALALLTTHVDDESTEAITAVIKDPTGSVRIAAAEALSGRQSPKAWGALVELLQDATDTSREANHGYGWHEDHIPEYGVAVSAAHALAAIDAWPTELEEAVNTFLASPGSTCSDVRKILSRHRKHSEQQDPHAHT
jgi:HEAT repeat protein